MPVRIYRLAVAFFTLIALVGVPGTASAQGVAVCSPGTDSAVASPVEIDRACAISGTANQLIIPATYSTLLSGVFEFHDAAPQGQTSSNDEMKFKVNNADLYVTYAGVHYKLLNVHFHGLSEHRFAGDAVSPIEAHLQHESVGGQTLVLAVQSKTDPNIFTSTTFDAFLTDPPRVTDQLKSHSDINLANLLPVDRTHYRYTGSLTTPPYTPGVTWIVFNARVNIQNGNVTSFNNAWTQGGTRVFNHRTVQTNSPPPNVYAH
ncbi:carbonic anhydrase family protein [Nonomuraea sp. NPDC059007]|uniref:carbonic anhydrase family protein n=1 Tax=Nonomuraea sp. NPDC059007 TaxID=3346692 RepID=UPI0036AD1D45